jgi:hypothetical protein
MLGQGEARAGWGWLMNSITARVNATMSVLGSSTQLKIRRRTKNDSFQRVLPQPPLPLPPLHTIDAVESAETYHSRDYRVVLVRLKTGMTHLSVKRFDEQPIHSWQVLQSIKNELVGPEREAVELFPSESRLVDTANIYHLWVLAEGERFNFGFEQRRVVTDREWRGPVTRRATARKTPPVEACG